MLDILSETIQAAWLDKSQTRMIRGYLLSHESENLIPRRT